MAYPQKKKHTSCPLKTDEMYAFYIVSFIVPSSGDYRVINGLFQRGYYIFPAPMCLYNLYKTYLLSFRWREFV